MLFVFKFRIYLFIYLNYHQQQQRNSPPIFIYLCKLVVDYMWFSFEYSIFICWFIQSNVNNSSASHHLFLFTYANLLLITCGFPFNIHYLFVYFFKAMSTTAAQVTTCFYLLMQIASWLHVLFLLIFSIYFFIYSKWCKQQQHKSPPVFIYLCKWVVDYMWFSF